MASQGGAGGTSVCVCVTRLSHTQPPGPEGWEAQPMGSLATHKSKLEKIKRMSHGTHVPCAKLAASVTPPRVLVG